MKAAASSSIIFAANASTLPASSAPAIGSPPPKRVISPDGPTPPSSKFSAWTASRTQNFPRAPQAQSQAKPVKSHKRASAVLVSDYGFGAASPALVKKLNAKLLTLDSRYRLLEFRDAGITAATPNEPELEAAYHSRVGTDAAKLEDLGQRALRDLGLQALVVTRGKDGMALFERSRVPRNIPIYGSDAPVDVTGAGDTVIAVFTLALAAGASYLEAAHLANYAGGIVVMKRRTATVTQRGTEPPLCARTPRRSAEHRMDTREKIVSREGLHGVLDEHRRSSRKIVFANGVFDLLHVGHVRYLQAARAEGDLLVVGINSDSSTRKLKGPGRPILTERARAALVAALRSVNYVVIFDELDVNSLAPRTAAGRARQRHRLHCRTRFPSANSPRCSASASPSSAIPSNIPRAILLARLRQPGNA